MQASTLSPRRTSATARRVAAAAFFAAAALSTAAGLAYWRASLIDPSQREVSRGLISEGRAPAFMEDLLARQYLTACVDVMSHWTFAVEPTGDRRSLSEACARLAQSQQAWGSRSAEAELVFALDAHLAGDSGAAVEHVRASQRLAPRDLWNAVKRVELVLRAVPEAELGRQGDYFGAEFGTLTGSYRGVDTAVSLYVKYPALRPALLNVAGEMSPGERLRFLNRVTRRVGG